MAIPTTRQQFIDYCLRKLGAPVQEIEVDPDQCDDRVDEALKLYWERHFDGSDKIYYKHLITQTDKDNKYITLPENIIGTVNIFNASDLSITSNDLFNVRYQVALNEMYTLTSISMVPYYMAMEHLALIQDMLQAKPFLRFTKHKNRLYLDMNWEQVKVGGYLIVEAYEVVDPAVYSDVWGDLWLQRYTTALIQEQWGRHLTKFDMTLPGGVRINGDRILSDAVAEKLRLEEELVTDWSLPVYDMFG